MSAPAPETDDRPTAQLRALQPNWDGYGGAAICPVACDRADWLVYVLLRCGIEATVTPTGRGGVDVEWRAEDALLVAEGLVGAPGCEHEGLIELLPVRR